MPQSQTNAFIATSHYLPEIAHQLEIANKLKALELKLKLENGWSSSVDAISIIDKIIK